MIHAYLQLVSVITRSAHISWSLFCLRQFQLFIRSFYLQVWCFPLLPSLHWTFSRSAFVLNDQKVFHRESAQIKMDENSYCCTIMQYTEKKEMKMYRPSLFWALTITWKHVIDTDQLSPLHTFTIWCRFPLKIYFIALIDARVLKRLNRLALFFFSQRRFSFFCLFTHTNSTRVVFLIFHPYF